MNILYLISNVFIIILLIGIILSVYYLYVEKGIADWKEFLYILFFAPIGFGNWKYNNIIRSGQTAPHSKNWYIYFYLIRINWCIIAIILLYEVYAFYHLYHFYMHFNEMKENASTIVGATATDIFYALFGWMLNWSINIVFVFMAIVLFFSFIVCFIFFILLPKLLLKKE